MRNGNEDKCLMQKGRSENGIKYFESLSGACFFTVCSNYTTYYIVVTTLPTTLMAEKLKKVWGKGPVILTSFKKLCIFVMEDFHFHHCTW